MKKIAKSILTVAADAYFYLKGLQFPDYISSRHKIDLMFFGNEMDVFNLMKKRLRPGMLVLDVGANVGLISRISAKKVGSSGKVIAFEPDPYTRGFLDHNVRKFSNVSVSPIALSDDDTTAQFHIHPHSGTSNSLVAFAGAKKVFDVECMRIDTFLNRTPGMNPDYIKIDVEGAELKVLGGMGKTIKNLPDLKIVIEYCPENLANAGVTPEDYYSFLDGLGLSSEIIRKDGSSHPVSDLADLTAKLGSEVYCNLLCYRKS